MAADYSTLLVEIKTALRLSSASFDTTELTPLIEACKADMSISGVEIVDTDDLLTRQAIKFYCKAYFGASQDSGAEKYAKCYEKLRDAMALSGDYREDDDNDG